MESIYRSTHSSCTAMISIPAVSWMFFPCLPKSWVICISLKGQSCLAVSVSPSGCQVNQLCTAAVVFGASLSEPHIDEFAANFPYIIYISGVRRAINHFRPLFCGFLCHSLIQKPFTNCSHAQRIEDVNQERSTSSMATIRAETDHSCTYLFSG